MGTDQDRNFARNVVVVLAVLIGFTASMIWAARFLVDLTGNGTMNLRRVVRVEQHTAPVFQVVTNRSELERTTQPSGSDAEGRVAEAERKSAEEVYQAVCSSCHDSGLAGAPKTSDQKAWSQRLSGGKTTLYKNAINGLNAMPAKGGDQSLSEAEVKKAVDHMVEQSGA